MPSHTVITLAGNKLRELEFDFTIFNGYQGGPGWTITAAASNLGINASWGTSDPDDFDTPISEAISAIQAYLANQEYNAGSVVTGITEDAGTWTGTPVYSGPYVQLMTFLNSSWDGVGGESSPPVTAANRTEAIAITVAYLLTRPNNSIPGLMDAVETTYPDLYTEVMAGYIDQKLGV